MPDLIALNMGKSQEAFAKAKSLHDTHCKDGGELPAEKVDEFKGYMADATKFKTKADEEKQYAALADFHEKAVDPFASREGGEGGEALGVDDKSVVDVMRTPRPFASLGQQLKSVVGVGRSGVLAPGLKALTEFETKATGMSEAVGSDGGFLLQDTFAAELLRNTYAASVLARKAKRFEVGAGSNSLVWRGLDDYDRSAGNQFGGVVVYWNQEAEAATKSAPKFTKQRMEIEKLTGLCYMTEEQIEDTVMLGSIINEVFPDVFNYKIDDAMYRGTGAGQPKGILNSNALVTVAKEAGQAGQTIQAENIEKMFARMAASSLGKAEWNINQDCWPQIFQLHHVIGTGGVAVYVGPAGIKEAPFGTLLGRPIMPIEQASTLGTLGDIVLADWSRYMLAGKGGIKSAASIHVKFVEGETALRFTLRINGQPIMSKPLTPAQGTATQSSFVSLAARA